jgi:hypothetical protein
MKTCHCFADAYIGFSRNLVGLGCSKHRWCSSSILMGSAVYTGADENNDTLKCFSLLILYIIFT